MQTPLPLVAAHAAPPPPHTRRLTLHLQHQPQHAVRRRVLGPKVDGEVVHLEGCRACAWWCAQQQCVGSGLVTGADRMCVRGCVHCVFVCG
jgi:hypothetical protein